MPTKEQIKQAREAAGLTQLQAIRLLRPGSKTARTWLTWETKPDSMPPEMWEYFLLKTKSAPRRAGDKN